MATAGESSAKSINSRPFTGRVTICRSVITVLTSVRVGSINSDVAATSTFSATLPGVSEGLIRRWEIRRVAATPQITVMTGASCEGLFADGWLAIVRDRRLYKLRADRVILATGALEQPAVFRNNDLPGIMLGSAAQRLIKAYGVRPGNVAVVLTANDLGYGIALDLADAGVKVAAVLDLRSAVTESALRSAAVTVGHGGGFYFVVRVLDV